MQKPVAEKLNYETHSYSKAALFWAVLLLALDRCLKAVAIIFWSSQARQLIDGWLLTYSLNRRLAFSLAWTGPTLIIFLTILILILTVYAINTIKKQPNQIWGWSLLLAGAYSNLYDRIIYGGVIDYLASWWTIFNLADIFVGLGLIILLWPKQKGRL